MILLFILLSDNHNVEKIHYGQGSEYLVRRRASMAILVIRDN